MVRRFALLPIALFLCAVCAVLPQDRTVFRFGFASSQNPAIVIDTMGPLIDILSDALGVPVEFVQKSSFSEMQRAFISQEIDFGIVNAFSFLRILSADAVIPVAARVIEGSREYQTYFFTRQDSDITEIHELHRRTVAMGDPYSTSSFLIPHYVFSRNGIDPDSDFLETVIITKQDSLIISVVNRTADVGVAASFIYNDQPEAIRDHLRVFKVSDPFPLGPFVVNRNLGPELIDRIQSILLSLSTTAEGRAALESSGIEGFEPVSVRDYAPLVGIVGSLDLD